MRMLDEMIDRQKLIRMMDLSERMYLAREREREYPTLKFNRKIQDSLPYIMQIGGIHPEKETLKYRLYKRKKTL